MSWREFLTVRGVLIPARDARTCAGAEELDWVERKLRAPLPADFRRFSQEIGAGSLGDIDFIVPGRARRGGFRKRDRLIEHVRLARRAIDAIGLGTDPEDALSFAATADGDWFFYSARELQSLADDGDGRPSDAPIYLVSADLDEALPCAGSLGEFIEEVCLGSRLVELGLYESFAPAPLREFYPVL